MELNKHEISNFDIKILNYKKSLFSSVLKLKQIQKLQVNSDVPIIELQDSVLVLKYFYLLN
jgi:hypothetical protein